MIDTVAMKQEAELLFAEMRRALILLDAVKSNKENPWHDCAELRTKLHEIRRDSIRFEKRYLKF